jgi:hypothetical protein
VLRRTCLGVCDDHTAPKPVIKSEANASNEAHSEQESSSSVVLTVVAALTGVAFDDAAEERAAAAVIGDAAVALFLLRTEAILTCAEAPKDPKFSVTVFQLPTACEA